MDRLTNRLADIVQNNFLTGYRAYDVCRLKSKVTKLRAINDITYDITSLDNIYYNEESVEGQKIPYIYGDINSYINFPNIIKYTKYTICAITRYNGDDTTKKNNVLTITNSNDKTTSIGHNNNWAGIIEYTNSSSILIKKSNANYYNNWVVTCISYDTSMPDLTKGEAYIGSKNDPNGSINTKFSDIDAIIGKLAINTTNNVNNLNSSWALSHLLVWDTALSPEKLKIVYSTCIDYLFRPAESDIILYKNMYPLTLPTCIENFINQKNNLNISTQLWAGYYAGNYNSVTNELPDLNGNTSRNIKSDRIINVKYDNSSSIPYLYGDKNSFILFPENSINSNFTICSITKYTSTDPINNNKIFHSWGPNSDNFYHGHYKNKKGVVSYTGYEFSKGFPTNSPINSWVVACAKNTNSTNPSDNVIINGVSCGLFIEPEYTENIINRPISTLTINYDGSFAYNSEWALSYLLIWDSHLSDIDLKNVSIALNSFLENGETLTLMNSQNQISYSAPTNPTIAPSTITPSTIAPSTITPSTLAPSMPSSRFNQSEAKKLQYSNWNLTQIQKEMLGIL